jgi:hypothetical protein
MKEKVGKMENHDLGYFHGGLWARAVKGFEDECLSQSTYPDSSASSQPKDTCYGILSLDG